jgi:hypothetical protein
MLKYHTMKFIKRDLPLAMIKTAAKVSGNRSLMKNSQKLKKLIERELIISESFSHFIMNEWIFVVSARCRVHETNDCRRTNKIQY